GGSGIIGVLAEYSSSWDAHVPAFNTYVNVNGGFSGGVSRSRGPYNVKARAASVSSGWFWMTFRADLGSSFTELIVNNVPAPSETGGTLASPFGNHPIYVGARNQSAHFFLGDIAMLMMWDRLLVSGELAQLWFYAQSRFGVS